MSNEYRIIDTFPRYLEFWDKANSMEIQSQFDLWEAEYLSEWPELFEKQKNSYEERDWKEIALERIIPFLEERHESMIRARNNLLGILPRIHKKASDVLGFEFPINYVIHVGIGSAGWATRYKDKPAVIFGLEMIAEEGWIKRNTLKGLAAHEIGHLYHLDKREDMSWKQGPFWDLYVEGFAQVCEHKILNEDTWHMQASKEDWLEHCQSNTASLAQLYLERVEKEEGIKDFFGNWFEIDGYSMCGYYLGHELVKMWLDESKIDEIALLGDKEIETKVRDTLKNLI